MKTQINADLCRQCQTLKPFSFDTEANMMGVFFRMRDFIFIGLGKSKGKLLLFIFKRMIQETIHLTRNKNAEAVKRGRILEYFTLGWNLLEAFVAVGSGVISGSAALIGFGLDSLIECASGAALLWRLRDGEVGESREKFALKLVGISFLLLAAYVAFDSGKSLLMREVPETSYAGIIIAALSLIVMPLLAKEKRKVAVKLNSRAMSADSKQTEICAYLSAILLGGLLLNALFGFWWADPIAALIMTPIIAKEGIEALRGETCCEGVCH